MLADFLNKSFSKDPCCHRQHTYRLECLNLGAECARFHVFLGHVVPGVTGIPALTLVIMTISSFSKGLLKFFLAEEWPAA